jgi:predicted RNA-binding Zn-ribbon protein involved in translation (DUF1610 family)
MAVLKQNKINLNSYKWFKLDLVRGDQDTSFECPSCGARIRFSHSEASSKNPKATGQLKPVGQTVRLSSGTPLFFDQIHTPQPLIRGLSFVIWIATVIFLIWFWKLTILKGGPVPWWLGALALIGGWGVIKLVLQPAISPKLPLWRFNCPECGAGYVLATNGTKARIGDNKGRIVDGSIPGNQKAKHS